MRVFRVEQHYSLAVMRYANFVGVLLCVSGRLAASSLSVCGERRHRLESHTAQQVSDFMRENGLHYEQVRVEFPIASPP